MPLREQVLELARAGYSYEEVAARLGVPAGRAYLIATGVPVDTSASLAPEDLERVGIASGSTQHLANPPAHNPTQHERVLSWARQRAHDELATTTRG